MIIIDPYVEINESQFDIHLPDRLELAARTAYKSEDKFIAGQYPVLEQCMKARPNPHESVLEHEKITVKFVVDRGISHEIVRHRIAAYTQESTRYCNYSKDKFGKEITVIRPYGFAGKEVLEWLDCMLMIEQTYLKLVNDNKIPPQWARSVLPNSLKTEVVTTYNIREWRHFFRLRCHSTAHPQMRQVAIPLLHTLQYYYPMLFEDLPEYGASSTDAEVKIIHN